MRSWTVWNWMAYAALVIGAIILAADAGLKRAPTLLSKMPEFLSSEIWAFAPLALVLLSTVIFLVGLRRNPPSSAVSASMARSQNEAGPITSTTISKPVAAEKQERIFVGRSITPIYLMSFFRDHTGIQGKKLTEVFVGKWMKVSGRVGEVLSTTGTFAQLTFERGLKKDAPEWVNYVSIYMYFRGPWIDRMGIVKHKDQLTVIGMISHVDAISLHLENCELVDVEQEWSEID